ncbi:MAG: alpha/beta hydrolase [Actinobacteria bacterium]|nr:alpha/beta hydrolase [Actinomycetota bacterium]
MHGYLAFPERAAKVANYVNIDGRTAAAPPGGVRTLAIWAGLGTPGRQIVGAINVTIPNQTHVQVATSAESFVEMYRFFTGKEPATSDIVPEPPGRVRVAGRAVFFPLNKGVEGATVQMWEVDPATGRRAKKKPEASFVVGADGAWGPFKAKGGRSYEFVILREGFRPHHFYMEPFIRSDYLVRLNTSPPGGIGDLLDVSDNHVNLVIIRNKELWGDQGVNNDVLLVQGINVVTPAGCAITKRTIGMFVYDWHADGVSDLSTPIPFLHALPFLTGIDLVVPAAEPPDRTVSMVLVPRGGGGRTQVINVPNWASSGHAVTVMFNDFRQDVNTWVEYAQSMR